MTEKSPLEFADTIVAMLVHMALQVIPDHLLGFALPARRERIDQTAPERSTVGIKGRSKEGGREELQRHRGLHCAISGDRPSSSLFAAGCVKYFTHRARPFHHRRRLAASRLTAAGRALASCTLQCPTDGSLSRPTRVSGWRSCDTVAQHRRADWSPTC